MLSLPGFGPGGLPVAVEHVGIVGDVHGVGAVGQVGEAVVAVGVGGGGGNDVAAGVIQHHGHTGEAAGFAANQRAVGVAVVPDRATDGVRAGGVAVAEVLEQVNSTSGDRHRGGAVAAAVRVDRVAQAGVGQRTGLYLDDIGGRGQPAEEVLAVFVGGGDGNQGGAICSKQLDQHAFQAFAGVKRAAGVAIQEDRIADQTLAGVMPGGGVAEVLEQVAARGQVGHWAEIGCAGTVRVISRDQVAEDIVGVVDPHQVVLAAAGRQTAEQVLASGVGDVGSQDDFIVAIAEDIVNAVRIPGAIAVGILDQGHRHAGQAGFGRVDIAGAVRIQPQGVADRAGCSGGRLVAEVGVDEHVSWTEHDWGCGFIVIGPGRAKVIRVAGLGEAGWRGRNSDHVRTGRQAIEDVAAVGVRGRAGNDIVAGAQHAVWAEVGQLDGDAGDADFLGVLNAVAVNIHPDLIADGAGGA